MTPVTNDIEYRGTMQALGWLREGLARMLTIPEQQLDVFAKAHIAELRFDIAELEAKVATYLAHAREPALGFAEPPNSYSTKSS